jgi:hypothetical protein
MASSLSFNRATNLDAATESALPSAHVNAMVPQCRFCCRLDDQPDHLVPERYLRNGAWEGLADRPLFVNPQCQLLRGGTLPDSMHHPAPWLDHFDPGRDMIWIKQPFGVADLPFWLGAEFAKLMAAAQPGDPAATNLSGAQRRVLAMAGVLVSFDHLSTGRSRREQDIAQCSLRFREKRYVAVGSLIHPFHISALRRYYRSLIRLGQLTLGDCQTPRRYVAYNEGVLRFFHQQLSSTVGAIVREPVKPSYVYLGSYQSGAELAAHTDREQCAFTISLCLDFSPEPPGETPWPLHLHTSAGKTTVFQGIGDALIYSGTEIPHSRERLASGRTSTSVFFHYVPEGFSGSLD